MQPNSEAVGPMKPLPGTHPDRGRELSQFLKKTIDQDTEGRVGEAFERPPFKRSRERVPDPCQALMLDTGKATSNIQSWPHSQGSGRNVRRKIRLGGGAEGHNSNESTLPGSAAPGRPASQLAPLCL
jgi:hypothetical protein